MGQAGWGVGGQQPQGGDAGKQPRVALSARPGNTNLPPDSLGRQEILPVHVLKREK